MVQAKHQKSKPKKQPSAKKHGKQSNITQFNSHFEALGLKVVKVTADGNCFFRALADQLEGNEEEHEKYRLMVVGYILKHREEFEPFIEDEAPFDEYCESMKKDGTWAGNMELQAASLVSHSNICIHRIMSPRWYIRNFDNNGARMIHLSYHDGEHYDSVRLKDDPCHGPAKHFEVDTNLSATSHQARAMTTGSKSAFGGNFIDATSLKLVMAGTGCENVKKAEQVLLEVDGNIDAAIEFLISEQQMGKNEVQNGQLPCGDESSDGREYPGYVENENSKQTKEEAEDKNCEDRKCVTDSPPVQHGGSSSHDDKIPMSNNIPRNKVCPCGSRKKYKACCGAVAGRSAKIVINQNVTNKARKGRARGGMADLPSTTPSIGSKGDPLDLGALCI